MITITDVSKLQNDIETELQKRFPMFRANISTLGGEDNAAIMLVFSLDDRSKWNHGYIENSRYYRFSIDHTANEFEVENFISVKGYKMRSFKTSESIKVIEKLNKFFDKIIKELGLLV